MSDPAKASRREAIPDHMVDAAIDWVLKIRFNTPDDATTRAFEAWIRADDRHAEAWRQLQSAQEQFDALPGQKALNVLDQVAEKRKARGISRRNFVKLAVLGGICLAAGQGVNHFQRATAKETMSVSTPAGGRRTLKLTEGTVIELNTDTIVHTELTRRSRRVRLMRGEVLITTGKDDASSSRRPFWVETPFGCLTALGTRFAVCIMSDRVRIAVLSHAVRLGNTGVMAQAGETWTLGPGGARKLAEPAARSADWLDGVIVARKMPLPVLLTELSRYRAGKILWDPRVAGIKVSGIYHTRDIDNVLEILAQTLPITVSARGPRLIHITFLPPSS